jgi:hypothetical protein
MNSLLWAQNFECELIWDCWCKIKSELSYFSECHLVSPLTIFPQHLHLQQNKKPYLKYHRVGFQYIFWGEKIQSITAGMQRSTKIRRGEKSASRNMQKLQWQWNWQTQMLKQQYKCSIWSGFYCCVFFWIAYYYFLLLVLGFELRAFAQAGFEPWSSWSLPPE